MNIFDATISDRYVYLINSGEVIGVFPTASVIAVVSRSNLQGFSINPMTVGETKKEVLMKYLKEKKPNYKRPGETYTTYKNRVKLK